MRSSAGTEGWFGVAAVSLTVKLKTVVTMLALGPNGVEAVLIVRSCTCAGPRADPSMAVAETIPLAFEVVEALLTETDCDGDQVTGTLASGFPEESSTRAVSGDGNCEPGGPDWSAPLSMRRFAGTPAPDPVPGPGPVV